jgi:hypothetical protein
MGAGTLEGGHSFDIVAAPTAIMASSANAVVHEATTKKPKKAKRKR